MKSPLPALATGLHEQQGDGAEVRDGHRGEFREWSYGEVEVEVGSEGRSRGGVIGWIWGG